MSTSRLSVPPSDYKQPDNHLQVIQNVIQAINLQNLQIDKVEQIFSKIHSCSTWSTVVEIHPKREHFLATCAVYIATRAPSDNNLSKLEVEGVSLFQIQNSEAKVSLVEFFEILNASIATLGAENSAFAMDVIQVEKKLVIEGSLYSEISAIYDQFFNLDSDSIQNDLQFKSFWLLYVWIKSKEPNIGTDVELNVYLFVSLLLWLLKYSPKTIQGISQEDILNSFSLHLSSIPQHFLQLPSKHISSLPFSNIFDELEKVILILESDTTNAISSSNDYRSTVFLYDNDSIGTLSKFNSAPVYQLHAQKMKNGDSVFYSPVLSPVRNAALISPVHSTTLSVQTLQTNVPLQDSLIDEELLKYLKTNEVDFSESVSKRMEEVLSNFAFPTYLSTETVAQRKLFIKLLYFQVLKRMLAAEENRLHSKDFSHLLKNETFHKSLIVCSIETVLFIFNMRDCVRMEELLRIVKLTAFDLSKIIESFVLHTAWLSPIMKRHFRGLEEQILDSLAWLPDSNLLEQLKKMESVHIEPAVPTGSKTPDSTKKSQAVNMYNSKQQVDSHNPAVDFFFRKLYRLSSKRVQDLFQLFSNPNGSVIIEDAKEKMEQVWNTVVYILNHSRNLLIGRHVDHIIMCSMYAICTKVNHMNVSFRNIIFNYRYLCENSRLISPIELGKILWQIPLEVEGKFGDIVKFYNGIYVSVTKDFIMKCKDSGAYPMPTVDEIQSPQRVRVSQNANVFLSPRRAYKNSGMVNAPNTIIMTMNYSSNGPTQSNMYLSPARSFYAAFSSPSVNRIQQQQQSSTTNLLASPSHSLSTSTSIRPAEVKQTKAKRTLFMQDNDDEDENDEEDNKIEQESKKPKHNIVIEIPQQGSSQQHSEDASVAGTNQNQ